MYPDAVTSSEAVVAAPRVWLRALVDGLGREAEAYVVDANAVVLEAVGEECLAVAARLDELAATITAALESGRTIAATWSRDGEPLSASVTPLNAESAIVAVRRARRRESRFGAIIERASEIVIVTDGGGHVIYANDGTAAALDCATESVLGCSIFDLLHPDDVRGALESFAARVADAAPMGALELRFRRADGGFRVLEIIATNLLADAAVGGVVWHARDLSERREAQQRFRQLFERSPVAQAIVRPNVPGLIANATFADLFGTTRAALATLDASELAHADDRHSLHDDYVRLHAGEVSHIMTDRRYVRVDGESFDGRVSVSALRGDDGGIEFFLITLEDVTAEKRAAEAVASSEARFRALVDNSPDIVAIMYPDGEWEASDQATRLLGYANGFELPGGVLSLVHPEDVSRAAEALQDVLAEVRAAADPLELRLRAADGSYRDFECVGRNLGHDADVGGVVITARDVTQRKRSEHALRAAEERFRIAFEHSPVVISLVKLDGTIIDINPSGCALLGAEYDAVVGTAAELAVHPDDRQHAMDATVRQLAGEEERVEFRMLSTNGEVRWVLSHASLVPARREGDEPYVLTLQADISARKELEAQLQRQATRDALTDLLNRHAVMEHLTHLFARRVREPVAVMFADLDRFKAVNDTFGHAAGDETLRVVADRIRGAVRSEDSCARLGGDEFVVVCEHPGAVDDVLRLAGRVRDRIALPIAVGDTTVSVDASIGVAVASPGDDVASLLLRADAAAYRAKHAGGGRAELAFD